MRTPDEVFVKELKEIDEALDVGWNQNLNRWQVVRDDRRFRYMGHYEGKPLLHSWSKKYLIFTVKNEDGSYRPLDIRVIDKLHEIDTYNKERTSVMMARLEEEEERYKKNQARRQDEMIHDITMDNLKRLQDGVEELTYRR